SGANFTALTGLHADNHSWAFAPQPGGTSTVFCGNDGGIFRSDDGGTTWNALNAGGLQTALFYNMAVRPDATASVTLGAMQDNGVQTTSGAGGIGWISPQGGDGWDVAYDGVTAGQAYATSGFWPGQDPTGAVQACTRVFVSTADGTDLPPTVPTFGQSFPDVTPWFGAATDQGCYLASVATDPSAAGIVYVAGNQNLWQSRDGGNTWNIIGAFPTGFITARASVAPSNGNNVVVAAGTQVSVSTNALGPVAGVTFTNITRNLPNRNLLRAAFDPNDPTVIYAVLGGFNGFGAGQIGHVFRTTIGGTAWTDISPDLDVPFGALALDGSDTPTTIYVGTDLGVLRSVDQGATWYVLDDIHFPKAPVTDLEIGRGSGILRAATYGRGVFQFTRPDGPAITVNLEDGLEFGTVCEGPEHLTLQIFNVGSDDLIIHSVQRLMGSTAFEVDPFPATPLVIGPGEEVDFTVRFTPTTPGTSEAVIIRITSNDPGAPVVDLLATGIGGTATAELAIADAGDFGEVCLGWFVDRDLVINNAGDCPLEISAINSTSPDFVVPGVFSFPLVVTAGGSITVPLRFQPGALGAASATISVVSNDPASPAQVRVEGTAPAPRLVLSIADSGDFGDTCVGDFHDLPLTLSNSGGCKLTITGMSSSSGEFLVPDVDAFPLTIAPGTAVELSLRFQPTSFGAKSATITVTSDDPASPATLAVSGTAPSGKLAVTGTTHFGAVELGVRALQTVSICNVGDCDLHVTKVAFKPLGPCEKYRHRRCGCGPDCDCECKCHDKERECDQQCLNFKIVTNPFPATVHPGSCLGVLIQYVPTCDNAACCELVIESDDPDNPSQTLFVTGHLRRTLYSALKCWAAQELQEILEAGKG
ncbi:MAG: choice-of-anchor D domain-containing protein, partial [Candidatus Binatia bacterium]